MRRFVLAMLSLFLLLLVFGCASTRSTRKGKLAGGKPANSNYGRKPENGRPDNHQHYGYYRKQREAKHSYRVYKS